MGIDVGRQIGAVTRKVISRQHNGRPAKVVIASRQYDSMAGDVWDAITNAERIPRWFLPISGDLRLGGRYNLEGNAGGQITACQPPRHLGLTWEYAGDVSWVEVRLTEELPGKTTLVLEHMAHVGDNFWNEYGPGAAGVGWDLSLLGLDRHLSTGVAMSPQEAATWPASAEGSAFIRGASDGWGRASIDAGTDATAAAGAAERTTAFYTGQPAPAND